MKELITSISYAHPGTINEILGEPILKTSGTIDFLKK